MPSTHWLTSIALATCSMGALAAHAQPRNPVAFEELAHLGDFNPLERRGEPVIGAIRTYTLPFCDNDTDNLGGGGRDWTIAPDTCMKVSTSTSFQIFKVPQCANGTQALLARYEGRDCNYGEITFDGGLVEVADSDLYKCQTVGPRNYTVDEEHASLASFGFYCDGRQSERPLDDDKSKAKKGSVSMNVCPNAAGETRRAPTWEHPAPDECVVALSGWQASIYKAAVCENGKPSRLAKWTTNRFCEGKYDSIEEITDDMIDSCILISAEKHGAMSFYCNGAGLGWALPSKQSVLLLASFWITALAGSALI
ncbi:unnamed protein product [Parascedosporium putredinis]|uniref:Uncharacterized protein n=1 Tax=Parascedosporium putredinis TaxID=1442378 RepID=A0A9P1GYJ4_9PEZI|nr:unnamed protein product [Parascedosporium putredinis]CAI7991822.1 unnamed protein product [Parascedosporium putredinis]